VKRPFSTYVRANAAFDRHPTSLLSMLLQELDNFEHESRQARIAIFGLVVANIGLWLCLVAR
jgi:hypothetical protein